MSLSPTRETAGSPAKSFASSDSWSISDRFLTAPQTPEGSVSENMVARQHSSSSLDSYVSADEELDSVTLTLPQLSLPTNMSEQRVTETNLNSTPMESSTYTSENSTSSTKATQTISIPTIQVHDQGLNQPRINELRDPENPEGLLSDVRMEAKAQDLGDKNTTLEEDMAKDMFMAFHKAALSPLPEEPEDQLDQLRMLPNPDLPEGHPYHGMKANDPVIYTDEHPYGIPMEIPQQIIEHVQHDAKIRPLNAQQKALAGTDQDSNTRSASDVVAPGPYMHPLRHLSRVNQPQGSRRSHAIPIVRPSSRTSTRPNDPSSLNPYTHGVSGVPSHYIPLYGVTHGMFYDPVTNLYIGDGPPRSKPERPDGTYPCTTEATMEAESLPKRSTGDPMHIKSKAFIDNAIASSKDRLAKSVPHPATHLADPNSQTAPSTAFKLYFCRCTGKWLQEPHECTEGPMKDAQIPEKAGFAPWEPLPEGWIKNRIMVDQSIYQGGKIPITPGLPTNWFKEIPVYDSATNQRLGLGPEFAAAAGSSSSGCTLAGMIPPGIGPAPPTNLPARGPPTTPPPKAKAKAPEFSSGRVITPADYEPASDSGSESSSDDTLAPSPTATVTATVNTETGEGSSSDAMAATHGARGGEVKVPEKKGKAGRKQKKRGKKAGSKW